MAITTLEHHTLPTSRAAGRALGERLVGEVMSSRLVACDGATPVRVVAATMAEAGIHSVLVEGAGVPERGGWGLLSDLDLMAWGAAGPEEDCTAAAVAAAEFLTIDAGETVDRAAQLMSEHETSHLVVFDEVMGRPVGIVSTLDVAAALAGGAGAGGPRSA